MNEKSEILIEELNRISDANNKNAINVNIFKYIGLCALDIICGNIFAFNLKNYFKTKYFSKIETAMGQSINALKEKDSEYIRAVLL